MLHEVETVLIMATKEYSHKVNYKGLESSSHELFEGIPTALTLN
jgi:hypothetical protein